jgi:hypothetical protein
VSGLTVTVSVTSFMRHSRFVRFHHRFRVVQSISDHARVEADRSELLPFFDPVYGVDGHSQFFCDLPSRKEQHAFGRRFAREISAFHYFVFLEHTPVRKT